MENKNATEVDIAPASGKITKNVKYRLRCVLKGYVEDIYYARFHTPSYHWCRKKKKFRRKNEQSHWTVKYRSRSVRQGACLKGMPRTITMQGLTLAAITDTEKTKL